MALRDTSRSVPASIQLVASPVAVAHPELGLSRIAKRFLDLVVTLVALTIVAVPMLCLALAIKLTSPGPILFRQPRVGRGGRLFMSLKFRSMYIDAEERLQEVKHLNEKDGPIFKIRDDPRITSVGRLLRRTSLDELPQLFNVLRGEMSLVGPRPALMPEVLAYDPWQLQRLTVKPGLTGLWQVSGRSDLSFDAMMRLDVDYINRWSIWFDICLLARTIPAVISGRGAY